VAGCALAEARDWLEVVWLLPRLDEQWVGSALKLEMKFSLKTSCANEVRLGGAWGLWGGHGDCGVDVCVCL